MSSAALSSRYRFGRFELQTEERRLLSNGTPVRLGPHAFDLLVALVERAGHLVTKDELLDRVWPRVIVEENTLQVHISALRKALGAESIATISGRGYRFTLALTPVRATVPAVAPPVAHNLPYPLTSFVGRETEIAKLGQLLTSTRLLTLTGAGGCGKTRLATHLAMRVREGFPAGVWLVELAPLTDDGLIPQAVAAVLDLKERPGTKLGDTIVEHVANRHMLLLLDNAEHMVGACAQLVDALLRRCAHLVILVTSRERLGITGEVTYRVPSLSVPSAAHEATPEHVGACESARLFVERARLEQPQFVITQKNAAPLASILRRLDGIALAIELAAPRVRSMSIDELGERLHERFALLVGGSRTALARHRTLRSMIDWSYELLDDAERAMLRRVSVFAGGWSLEAAEAVCPGGHVRQEATLELLTSLSDKNLVLAETSAGITRYGLLESIRHYARERLRRSHEEADTRRAHLAYLLVFTEKALSELNGRDQAKWLDRYEVEHDNLRTALSFAAAQGDPSDGLNLAAASWRFWVARGHLTQGLALMSEQLARDGTQSALRPRGKALHGAATLALLMGDLGRARRLSEESVQLFRDLGDRQGAAVSLGGLGNVLSRLGDYASARACLEEGLAIMRELGLRLDSQLNNLGIVLQRMGDFGGAAALHEEALALRRTRGDNAGIASSLGNLGDIATKQGSLARARELFEGARNIYREVGDPRGTASAAINLAFVLCEQGDYAGAQALIQESLPTAMKVGDRERVADALHALAQALATRDQLTAATLWGAGARLREDLAIALTAHEQARDHSWIARARAALDDMAAFDAAWNAGRAMTMDQAVRCGTEVT